jgi:hypothetical protein
MHIAAVGIEFHALRGGIEYPKERRRVGAATGDPLPAERVAGIPLQSGRNNLANFFNDS